MVQPELHGRIRSLFCLCRTHTAGENWDQLLFIDNKLQYTNFLTPAVEKQPEPPCVPFLLRLQSFSGEKCHEHLRMAALQKIFKLVHVR